MAKYVSSGQTQIRPTDSFDGKRKTFYVASDVAFNFSRNSPTTQGCRTGGGEGGTYPLRFLQIS